MCHLLHKNLLSIYYVQDFFVGTGDLVVKRKPLGVGARPALELTKPLSCPETPRQPPHCAQTEPGHKAELPKGGEGQTTQAVLLQDPEPSPQQPLPSLTILSLQPISGRLCEQMGGQVGVVRANTCGDPPA